MYSQSEKDYCEQWRKQMDTIQNIDFQLKFCKQIISKVDSICKIDVYLNLGWISYRTQQKTESSLYFYDKAIALGKQMGQEKLLSSAYTKKAYMLVKDHKHKEAIIWLEKARKMLEKEKKNKAWGAYYQGYTEIAANDFDHRKAIQYNDSTILVSKRINDTINLPVCYHNKGLYHFRLSNYEEAAKNLLYALELKGKQKKPNNIARTYYLLGVCYKRWNQHETAKKYLKKSISKAKQQGNDFLVLLNYSHLSDCHRVLNENDEALRAADYSLSIAKKLNSKDEIAGVLNKKGLIFLENFKKYNVAEKHFFEAYEIVRRSHNHVILYSSINGLLNVYLDKGNYKEVEKYLEPFEEVTKKLGTLARTQQLNKIYSEYYEKIGRADLAIIHLKKYHTIKDSISNQKVQTQVANLEKQYDTKKKELEIVNLNKEKEEQKQIAQQASFRQNLYLLVAILLFFLLVMGIWAFRKLKQQQNELAETNQVKDRLFSIIAHDLRGMIIPFQRSGKILKHHIDKGNHQRTIELSQELEKNSESLSNTLDNLLNWSLEQMNGYKKSLEPIWIGQQLEEIANSFEQQATYKNTNIYVKYDKDVRVNFDKGAFHVIFRNLIGNALKYTEDGNIRIKFKKDFNTLICSVSDTGIGISKERLEHIFELEEKKSTAGTQGEKGTGLGLDLVYRFVKMHRGIINVSSEKSLGTSFGLSFPLLKSVDIEMKDDLKPLSA